MLVLTRKSNQSIMIGDDIEVSVLAIMGEKVRIGIQAPRDIPYSARRFIWRSSRSDSAPARAPAKRSTRRCAAWETARRALSARPTTGGAPIG